MQLIKEKYDKSPTGAILREPFRSKIYKSEFLEPTQLYGEAKCVNFIARLAY